MRIVLLLSLVMIQAFGSYKDERSKSKHFDGQKFSNPVASAKSLWGFLQMRLRTEYAKWPDWIEAKNHKINPVRVDQGSVHITHINHATLLIQIAGLNIITDPIFSDRCSPISWAGPKRVRAPGVRFEDLPPIDIILISHNHYDHLDLPTIERLVERDHPDIYLGLGVGRILPSGASFSELDWWESVHRQNIKIHFVPVQHFSGRGLFDRNATLWGGFVIEADGKRIYFGGDTGYASHFKQTRERLGDIDIALLPIGAYEPRDFMGYAHVNPNEAVQAHLDLHAKVSIGMHYGTFQLTAEAYDAPVADLKRALQDHKIPADRFLTPEFGEVVKF